MPQRVDDGVYRSTVAAWKLAAPATVQERRAMKKVAQPEHAYTGYVPREEDSVVEPEKRRHAPILGYKGHLRHAEDCVGTTFTRGVEIAARPGVLTASDIAHGDRPKTSANAQARGQHGGGGSGYGDFARASGYGEFAAPGSGYGAFDGASGYGAFQAPPVKPTGADAASGYGAFDGASGYGAFQAPPNGNGGSGYGAFDGASGYGAFAAPPNCRGGSGYGEFDGASGYGQFMEAPGSQERAVAPLSSPQGLEKRSPRCRFPDGSVTGMRYTQAIRACGGEEAVKKLWLLAARTISQRYSKRTELLQAVKRSFEKRERENGGRMTNEYLKEALQSLSCVLTDDQVTALFGLYDSRCSGTVPMDMLLVALMDNLAL